MIYCGAPSPAICQGILNPAVSKIWPSSFSPFSLIFVEGHGDLQCCPKGETPARGRWPWLPQEPGGAGRGEGTQPSTLSSVRLFLRVSQPAAAQLFPFPW